jgi:hypothetical protein
MLASVFLRAPGHHLFPFFPVQFWPVVHCKPYTACSQPI